jgi:hypothetical protein
MEQNADLLKKNNKVAKDMAMKIFSEKYATAFTLRDQFKIKRHLVANEVDAEVFSGLLDTDKAAFLNMLLDEE